MLFWIETYRKGSRIHKRDDPDSCILHVSSLHVQVFVKDLFMEHAGWPLNDMERSYKFMVKHVQLWRVAFHGTSPRWIHNVYLAAIAAFYAKYGSFLYPPPFPS